MADLLYTLQEPFKYLTTARDVYILRYIFFIALLIVVVRRIRKRSSLRTSQVISLIPLFSGTILSVILFFTCRAEVLNCFSTEIFMHISNAYTMPLLVFINALVQTLVLTGVSLCLYYKSVRLKHLLLPILLIIFTYGSLNMNHDFNQLKNQKQYNNLPVYYMTVDKLLFPELHPSENQRVRNAYCDIHILLEADGIWHKRHNFLLLEKDSFTAERTKEDILNTICKEWKFYYDHMVPSVSPNSHHSFYPPRYFLVETKKPIDTISISHFHELAAYMRLKEINVNIGETRYTCPTNRESLDSLYSVWERLP